MYRDYGESHDTFSNFSKPLHSLQMSVSMPHGYLDKFGIVRKVLDVEIEMLIKHGTGRVFVDCRSLVNILTTIGVERN
jgi:hypothetical protein